MYFQNILALGDPRTKKLSASDKYIYLNLVATKQMEVNRLILPNKPSQNSGKENPFETAILYTGYVYMPHTHQLKGSDYS
ncbi:hypothetical protein CN585_30515 [Bacillus toyonensis]|uniref:Uncharacterized protein n=1 Tax=Bacillus toyonensis TaxID=155322 RepID=A0A2A8GZW9_9BACI|nr:hypothetical protein CN585_30515 [Bacillus toyonensis]